MAKTNNLISPEELNARLTPEERHNNASKAGKSSGKARREKKTAKELMSYLLSLPIDQGKPKDKFRSLKDIKGKNITALTAGLVNLTKEVMQGDKKAIELALRISGEMVEQIQVNTTDEAIEELKAMLDEPENVDE